MNFSLRLILFVLINILLQNCRTTMSNDSITGKPRNQRKVSEIQTEKTCMDLRENLLNKPNEVDFFELRIICAREKTFNPNYSNSKTRTEVVNIINARKYDEALEKVKYFFINDPVDIMAHAFADSIFEANKQESLSRFHRFMVNNLLYSIVSSGDGTSPAKAYYMISVKEEYNFLDILGFEIVKRLPTIQESGHYYDVFQVKHPKTGNIHTVYFNIDESFAFTQRKLIH
jgi:hypothetical protein